MTESVKGTLVETKYIAKETGFFRFALDEDISFQSGQYFHIRLTEQLKHHFTFVNSPTEKRTVSMATRLRDTEFKRTLKNLTVGKVVEIYKIKGEFVLPQNSDKPLTFIAMGIGITPFISMLRYIKEQSLSYKVTLIYSDSDVASMAFLPELKELAHSNPNVTLVPTITKDKAWQGENRRVNEQVIRDYIPKYSENLYFISGPPYAVESVVSSLHNLNIPSEQIKTESFTGY